MSSGDNFEGVADWNESQGSGADFSFDTSDFSKDDLGGEGMIERDGWYHLEVTSVDDELRTVNDKGKSVSPAISFELTVRKGVAGQSPEGARHYHRIYVGGEGGGPPKDGSRKAACRFGLGLGVLATNPDGKIVDPTDGSTKMTVALWHRALGRHIIAKLERGDEVKNDDGSVKYKGKMEIPFGRVYRPDDPSVKDVPKNVEALKMVGINVGSGTATTPVKQPAKQPAKQQQNGQTQAQAKPATPPAAAASDMSDL